MTRIESLDLHRREQRLSIFCFRQYRRCEKSMRVRSGDAVLGLVGASDGFMYLWGSNRKRGPAIRNYMYARALCSLGPTKQTQPLVSIPSATNNKGRLLIRKITTRQPFSLRVNVKVLKNNK